jgi:hypothetical protein
MKSEQAVLPNPCLVEEEEERYLVIKELSLSSPTLDHVLSQFSPIHILIGSSDRYRTSWRKFGECVLSWNPPAAYVIN